MKKQSPLPYYLKLSTTQKIASLLLDYGKRRFEKADCKEIVLPVKPEEFECETKLCKRGISCSILAFLIVSGMEKGKDYDTTKNSGRKNFQIYLNKRTLETLEKGYEALF